MKDKYYHPKSEIFPIKGTGISMNIPHGFIVQDNSFYNEKYKFVLSFTVVKRSNTQEDNAQKKLNLNLTNRQKLKDEFLCKSVKNELSPRLIVIKQPFFPGDNDCFWFSIPISSESHIINLGGVFDPKFSGEIDIEAITSAIVQALETLSR